MSRRLTEPPSPQGDPIELGPVTRAEAEAAAGWRYLPPDDFYDGSPEEVDTMLDPANGYLAVRAAGEFVGFICAGPDARVAGQPALEDAEDIGWGFRPDLIGRGVASRWAEAAVAEITRRSRAERQRVAIVAWNGRSLALAHRLGFSDPRPHHNATGEWTILTRPVPR